MVLDSLAKQILIRMPENLTKMEQARYLYIELGKLLSFDELYSIGNANTRKRIYHRAEANPIDWTKLQQGKREICVSISKMYKDLLEKIGIRAVTIKDIDDDKFPHVCNLVDIDEKMYRMDLQLDLVWIQSNCKTKHFAIEKEYGQDTITPEETEAMDRKIGYVTDEVNYTNNYLWMLKKATATDVPLSKKVKLILQSVPQYKDISKMQIIERMIYYQWVLKECLTDKEYRRVEITKLERIIDEETKEKEYTTCLSVREKALEYDRYLYSEIQNRYLPVEEEKLMMLLGQGLKPTGGDSIPNLSMRKIEKERKVGRIEREREL